MCHPAEEEDSPTPPLSTRDSDSERVVSYSFPVKMPAGKQFK